MEAKFDTSLFSPRKQSSRAAAKKKNQANLIAEITICCHDE